MKRAQAAMEFLMTYGWAILVVVGVIATLAYLGIFDSTAVITDTCSTDAGFSCTEWKAFSDGNVFFVIHNNQGVPLESVVISLADSSAGICAHANSAATIGNQNHTWQFRDVPNSGRFGNTTFGWNCSGYYQKSSTDRVNAIFEINYTRAGEQFSHTATGQARIRVG